MNTFKKALIATAVGIAFVGPAHAGAVRIDVNGTGVGADSLGVDQFVIDMFTWNAGNSVILNTTPQGAADVSTQLLAQASMASMSRGGTSFSYSNVPPGSPAGEPGGTGGQISGQMTYQLSLNVLPTANSGTAIDYAPGLTGGFFEIFYNPVRINSDTTGCGYGSHQTTTASGCGTAGFPGVLVLSGVVTLLDTVTLTQSGTTVTGLDSFADAAGDVDNGVSTRALSMGAMSIKVDVTYQNPTFILTNIISTTLDLEGDMQHTETGGSPFTQANPSDEVVGRELQRTAAQRAAAYGPDLINNIQAGSCTAGAPCDVHLQTNPSTSVLTNLTPEPGSVALFGFGLAMLGAVGRRLGRRRAA